MVATRIALDPPSVERWPLAPGVIEMSGDLTRFVTAYEEQLPGARSHVYVDPTDQEAERLLAAVHAILRDELDAAVLALHELGYDLLAFHDTVTETDHVVLHERLPSSHCWGLFILRHEARGVRHEDPGAHLLTPPIVEAPHPLHDRLTPKLGMAAYLRLHARAFLMAGAHRYANGYKSLVSDMARNPGSIFQRLHVALADAETDIVQVHGFNGDDYLDYPSVLLSNGSPSPDPSLYTLQAQLEARGETASVYDGVRWQQLGGLPNPQAQHTRAIGGCFYHMEHELTLRRDPARRAAVVAALAAVLGCDLPRQDQEAFGIGRFAQSAIQTNEVK